MIFLEKITGFIYLLMNYDISEQGVDAKTDVTQNKQSRIAKIMAESYHKQKKKCV